MPCSQALARACVQRKILDGSWHGHLPRGGHVYLFSPLPHSRGLRFWVLECPVRVLSIDRRSRHIARGYDSTVGKTAQEGGTREVGAWIMRDSTRPLLFGSVILHNLYSPLPPILSSLFHPISSHHFHVDASFYAAMPMTPQAGRRPALPVFLLSSLPPLPRSSVPACTTTVRPSTLSGPMSLISLSVTEPVALP